MRSPVYQQPPSHWPQLLLAVSVMVPVAIGCRGQERSSSEPVSSSFEESDPFTVKAANGGRAELRADHGSRPGTLVGSVRPSGVVGISNIYTFGPDGASFDPPLFMTIFVGPEEQVHLPGAVLAVRVGELWVPVPGSEVNPATRTVSAPIGHFSEYTVISNETFVLGFGTRFQTGSGVSLTTERDIELAMVALAGAVSLSIFSTPAQTLVLEGLRASTRYFVYVGGYHFPPLIATSDPDGKLSIPLEASLRTDVMVQPDHGTREFPRDCTGDGKIATSSSCTLTLPVYDSVQVTQEDYTVSCSDQGAILGSSTGGVGVSLFLRGTSVKDCEIAGFAMGVRTFGGTGGEISGVDIHDVEMGMLIDRQDISVSFSTVRDLVPLDTLKDLPIPFNRPNHAAVMFGRCAQVRFCDGGDECVTNFCPSQGHTLFGNTLGGEVTYLTSASDSYVGADFPLLKNTIYSLTISGEAYPWLYAGSPRSSNVFITNNTVEHGIAIVSASDSVPHTNVDVQKNTVRGTTTYPSRIGALSVGGCDGGCSIAHNNVTGADPAIYLGAPRGVTVEWNNVAGGITADGVGAPIAAVQPAIQWNEISGGRWGIFLWETSATVTKNHVHGTETALRIDGAAGFHSITLNDFEPTSCGYRFSAGATEGDLGLNGKGNYWGHACGTAAAFTPGVGTDVLRSCSPGFDSNVAAAKDSKAWGVSVLKENGIISLEKLLEGDPPGCQQIACVESAPTSALLFKPNH